MQGTPGTGLHGHLHEALHRPVAQLGALGGENESLVVGPGGDAQSLRVHQPVVPLGVDVGEIAWLGGEGFLDAALLEQEGGVVADNRPSNVG